SFGQVMVAQAFTQYFVIIVDYGFNFSATREISLNRHDGVRVSEIFCSIMLLKGFFFIISLLIVVCLVFTVEKFSTMPGLYLLSFTTVLSNVLLPTWFFQGLEQMKYITVVNLTSKIVSTIFIFALIRSSEHSLWVPLIYSASSILPSTIALVHARKIFKLKIILPTFENLITHLKNGWYIFLSSISTSLYSVTNTFLLGFLF